MLCVYIYLAKIDISVSILSGTDDVHLQQLITIAVRTKISWWKHYFVFNKLKRNLIFGQRWSDTVNNDTAIVFFFSLVWLITLKEKILSFTIGWLILFCSHFKLLFYLQIPFSRLSWFCILFTCLFTNKFCLTGVTSGGSNCISWEKNDSIIISHKWGCTNLLYNTRIDTRDVLSFGLTSYFMYCDWLAPVFWSVEFITFNSSKMRM